MPLSPGKLGKVEVGLGLAFDGTCSSHFTGDLLEELARVAQSALKHGAISEPKLGPRVEFFVVDVAGLGQAAKPALPSEWIRQTLEQPQSCLGFYCRRLSPLALARATACLAIGKAAAPLP